MIGSRTLIHSCRDLNMFMQVKNGERFYGESGRESAIFNHFFTFLDV